MRKLLCCLVIICAVITNLVWGEPVLLTLESLPPGTLPTVSKVIDICDITDQLEVSRQAALFALSPEGWDFGRFGGSLDCHSWCPPEWTGAVHGVCIPGPDEQVSQLLGYELNEEALTYGPEYNLWFHTDDWVARLQHNIGESPNNYGIISAGMGGLWFQCPYPTWGMFSIYPLSTGSAGSIIAWGYNGSGQCNIPSPNSGFIAVAAGGWHSLGLKQDGSIIAWGDNPDGRCNIPLPNSGFIAVAAGVYHSLGLKQDSSIVAWGCNGYGQCNIPSPNSSFIAIAGGADHSLGLKQDGSIFAWGRNDYGECSVPSPNSGFVAVAAGDYHSLGLKQDGSIVAWGAGGPGQSGVPHYGQSIVPSPNTGFIAVTAGGGHSLGLKQDGSIVAWGRDWEGQCNIPSPNSGFIAVDAGGFHSLGLKQDGSIVAWGANNFGQCNIPSPNTGFVSIAAGGYHSLGLKAEGPTPEFYMSLESTERIVSQIKGGFGKLPSEWERDFQGPIPDKDSPAGNWIFTSANGHESIIDAGELPGRPVPVLAETSLLGNGQPRGINFVSLVPVVGMIHDWYTWVTNLRGMQSDPAPEDLRQRSLSTGVNGNIRVVDFTGRDHIDLDVHFEFFGWAAGYGVGPETALVTNGLMSAVTSLSNPLRNLFEKTVHKIGLKFGEYCLAEDAVGYDARFRAKAEAAICFCDPINKCFDCPAITPDGTQSYLWQGGGVYEISSGPVWQGVDFQVIVPTNQNIPLLLELVTSVETAGWAHGGAEILHYKTKFTCPDIPDFGIYVIDSLDYRSLGSLETANGQVQASGQAFGYQGISFGDVLTGAAGCEYLRTGLVSAKECLGGIQSPTGYPFAFVEGTEQSGLMFPVKIPRKPKKLVLLFDMFATHSVTPDEPIVIQFGLISTEEILLTKTIEASAFTYKLVPEPNGGYLVHTGWQEMVVDISDIPSSETMFCIAVDSNRASVNFGFAQSDLLIIPEPALPCDFDADRIVNLTDYAMLASYWLEENCRYPDWCGATDLDFTGRVDFAELGTIGSNWLRERIIGDFEPDGDVDFSDLMELANYWLSSEPSLDIAPPGGDGRINFRDFAELAKYWLKATR